MASDQYHFHIESLSRLKGRSSVQYAAYVAGSSLKDERLGVRHDNTSKEEVRNSMIYLPDSAPDSLKEELKKCGDDRKLINKFRQKLWNSLEKYETHKNAVVGKAIDIAYPYELTLEQRKLCRDKVVNLFTSLGYVVDIADHDVKSNPHMQGIIGVRPMVNDETCYWSDTKEVKGFVCESKISGQTKTFRKIKDIEDYNLKNNDNFQRIPVIDPKTGKQKLARRNEKVWKKGTMKYNPINDKENLYKWRQSWEEIANAYLPDDRKISCKSYKARGIKKIPKRHIRAGGYKMGDKSDRVRQNKEIDEANKIIKQYDTEMLSNEIDIEGMENYLQESKDISVEQMIHNIRSEQIRSHNKELQQLFDNDSNNKNGTHIPHISGLSARQREIEEDIEEYLKAKDDKESKQKGVSR